MTTALDAIASMKVERDGTMHVVLTDGRVLSASMGRDAFEASSRIASSVFSPVSSQLVLQTTYQDEIVLEVAQRLDMSPLAGRPTIYLDQNHWSTLAYAIHDPRRVRSADELGAAEHLIDLTVRKDVVLPFSSAHLSETCKQANSEDRYRRGLTIAQLSRGWQLRDPLALRRFELRRALTARYRRRLIVPPAAVTLEPNAVHADRAALPEEIDIGLPEDMQWAVHAVRCIGGIVDALLDAEHLPMPPSSQWAKEMQRFAKFLAEDRTGREMRRRRTHAKFIADLGRELPEEARRAGVTPEELTEWATQHSEADLRAMPALGLFREVMHEKLCDPKLRWGGGDLIDMMYLTAGAAYCDHIVTERAHGSHITHSWRRQDVERSVHTSLSSLVEAL